MRPFHSIQSALLPLASIALGLAAHGQLRITEVQADPAAADLGRQMVELYNADTEPVELQSFTLCVSGALPPGHGCIFELPELVLPALTYSRVHWRADGESSALDIYTGASFDAIPYPIGSVALIDVETGIVRDYVQWGGDCSSVAQAHLVSQWTAGTWVQTPALGHAVAYDGDGDAYEDWFEDLSPTLGFANTLPGDPAVFAYGQGCAGALGEPLIGTGFGPPALGNASFEIRLSNAMPGSLAVLGMSPGAAIIHMFDCKLLIDFAQDGFQIVGERAVLRDELTAFPLPIPHDPVLIGLDVFLQAGVLDVTAPKGIAFTRGLEVTF